MAELPLVIVDVQRAGPSTGMPTKSEQSDLLMALFGRHGESPVIVIAPKTPEDCFDILQEAFKLAIIAMAPVIILSDANLANGSKAWRIPEISNFLEAEDKDINSKNWVIPGTPG